MKTKPVALVLEISFAILLAGCATPLHKEPSYVSPHFDAREITHFSVLPTFDNRADRRLQFEPSYLNWMFQSRLPLEHKLGRANSGNTLLRKRGYGSSFIEYGPPDLPKNAFEHLDPAWIKRPGNATGRWLMLFELEDAEEESSLLRGASVGVAVNMAIIDRETGEVLWRDHDVQIIQLGGPVGNLMMSSQPLTAVRLVHVSMRVMLEKLPDRSKLPRAVGPDENVEPRVQR